MNAPRPPSPSAQSEWVIDKRPPVPFLAVVATVVIAVVIGLASGFRSRPDVAASPTTTTTSTRLQRTTSSVRQAPVVTAPSPATATTGSCPEDQITMTGTVLPASARPDGSFVMTFHTANPPVRATGTGPFAVVFVAADQFPFLGNARPLNSDHADTWEIIASVNPTDPDVPDEVTIHVELALCVERPFGMGTRPPRNDR